MPSRRTGQYILSNKVEELNRACGYPTYSWSGPNFSFETDHSQSRVRYSLAHPEITIGSELKLKTSQQLESAIDVMISGCNAKMGSGENGYSERMCKLFNGNWNNSSQCEMLPQSDPTKEAENVQRIKGILFHADNDGDPNRIYATIGEVYLPIDSRTYMDWRLKNSLVDLSAIQVDEFGNFTNVDPKTLYVDGLHPDRYNNILYISPTPISRSFKIDPAIVTNINQITTAIENNITDENEKSQVLQNLQTVTQKLTGNGNQINEDYWRRRYFDDESITRQIETRKNEIITNLFSSLARTDPRYRRFGRQLALLEENQYESGISYRYWSR